MAAETAGGSAFLAHLAAQGVSGQPLALAGALVFLALVPVAAMSVTSFIKLSVVFAMLRAAVGAGQFPAPAITSLLAMVLTMHIMTPVARECYGIWQQEAAALPATLRAAAAKARAGAAEQLSPDKVSAWSTVLTASLRPLERFLRRHSGAKERLFFAGHDLQATPEMERCAAQPACTLPDEALEGLMPAFVLSELREAFAIGFSLFLPFLVIEIVIANVLAALGMVMVSPVTISLPFKLLLFVLCDGWLLLSRGLVLAYR